MIKKTSDILNARPTNNIGNKPDEYRWREITIDLPQDMDADIRLRLPKGQEIVLQYRIEAPSIDIIMPEGNDTSVTCWKGCDMEPAPSFRKQKHVRICGQLVIDLDPKWVKEHETP